MNNILFEELSSAIDSIRNSFDEISDERKAVLDSFALTLSRTELPMDLRFICTHNSRRSIFSEVWAWAGISYFNLPKLTTSSAGTESTAVYPTVIDVLKRSGFEVLTSMGNHAREFELIMGNDTTKNLWSKTINEFDHTKPFIAIMTCSDADQNCPFVPGALHRISLPYVDPKHSDGSIEELETYFKTSLHIAGELIYLFNQYSNLINEQ